MKHIHVEREAYAVRQLPDTLGPGNVLMLEAQFARAAEIVTGFGKLGTSGESLAKTAAQRMAGFLASEAYAGPHLADQLLLPFALAGGGSFTTDKLSLHATTNAEVIARFLPVRFDVESTERLHTVRIAPAGAGLTA